MTNAERKEQAVTNTASILHMSSKLVNAVLTAYDIQYKALAPAPKRAPKKVPAAKGKATK
jgi:hypothetical protein